MIDKEMQSLIDAPLANPNKINLPKGRRSAPRAGNPEYEGDFLPDKLTRKELRDRQENSHSAKIMAVLDYYAASKVSFEDIARYTNLTADQVARAMSNRGRLA